MSTHFSIDVQSSTSMTSRRSELTEQLSNFYSLLQQTMDSQPKIEKWATDLDQSLSPLEYELLRYDQNKQSLAGESSFSRRPSRVTARSSSRRDDPTRIKFLAQTVIKVLDHKGLGELSMEPRQYDRWHNSLTSFNENQRDGPRLSERQIIQLIRASAAVLQPLIPPDAALNIIADYLIAKEAQHSELMAKIQTYLAI